MKKFLILLILATLALTACSSEKEQGNPNIGYDDKESLKDEELLEIGEDYLKNLLDKNYQVAYNDFPHEKAMKKALSPEGYEEIFNQLYLQNGDFITITGKKIKSSGTNRIVTFDLLFKKRSISANVVFTIDGEISALN